MAISERTVDGPLLEVNDLRQEFAVGAGGRDRAVVQAVSGVSFAIGRGETLGFVGETGCGKSTVGRSVLLAPRPKSGEVRFQGRDLMSASAEELRRARSQIRMVFQDPFSSLDPRMSVARAVEEPLLSFGEDTRSARRARVAETFSLVGLDYERHGRRSPRELSGGQCQRVAIARALITSPLLIVCDEAVSSLDVLIQAQILNLFEQLRAEFGFSYLFISHDLGVVRQVSDRIAVMYLGRLCELGSAISVFETPAHPYTNGLLESRLEPSVAADRHARRRSAAVKGEPPSPLDPPSGCRFRTRCPYAQERCAIETPELREIRPGQHVACHFPLV